MVCARYALDSLKLCDSESVGGLQRLLWILERRFYPAPPLYKRCVVMLNARCSQRTQATQEIKRGA